MLCTRMHTHWMYYCFHTWPWLKVPNAMVLWSYWKPLGNRSCGHLFKCQKLELFVWHKCIWRLVVCSDATMKNTTYVCLKHTNHPGNYIVQLELSNNPHEVCTLQALVTQRKKRKKDILDQSSHIPPCKRLRLNCCLIFESTQPKLVLLKTNTIMTERILFIYNNVLTTFDWKEEYKMCVVQPVKPGWELYSWPRGKKPTWSAKRKKDIITCFERPEWPFMNK
jgi:hypothetical protein